MPSPPAEQTPGEVSLGDSDEGLGLRLAQALAEIPHSEEIAGKGKGMRAIVGALAVVAAMILSACGGAEGDTSTSAPSKTLYFTAIPGDDVTQLQEKFAPFEKPRSRTVCYHAPGGRNRVRLLG